MARAAALGNRAGQRRTGGGSKKSVGAAAARAAGAGSTKPELGAGLEPAADAGVAPWPDCGAARDAEACGTWRRTTRFVRVCSGAAVGEESAARRASTISKCG